MLQRAHTLQVVAECTLVDDMTLAEPQLWPLCMELVLRLHMGTTKSTQVTLLLVFGLTFKKGVLGLQQRKQLLGLHQNKKGKTVRECKKKKVLRLHYFSSKG